MARVNVGSKLYHPFTFRGASSASCGKDRVGRGHMVGGIAIAMFVALVGWGSKYFGWEDADGKVQLALITSFILGVIGGIKARG
jgi:hypothetical protein